MPKPTRSSPGCPHADICFCPLYHATHEGQGLGCDDGRAGEGGCAVDRGLDYAAAVARLDPVKVATLRFEEEGARERAQRDRNLRALGLH